ncbi:MAG: leucine-rich repeat domain-containing protein [Clostridia bacterium]|nr:leucine-rich repeat domain-containing protein [Clostridia bacterium]
MKNVFKKAISILLVAVMVFGAAPIAGFVGLELPELNLFSSKAKAEESTISGTCGENLTWTFNETTGELSISGTGSMTNWSYGSSVPWNSYRSSIKTVTLSDGVTSIGDYAFYDFECLTSITIPKSVTSIGSHTFSGCNSLTGIIVDAANTVYSSDENGVMFSKDKTELVRYPEGKTASSYVIPDTVTSIGDYAFSGCINLPKIIIPDSVTIPKSMTFIGKDAFGYCEYIVNVYYAGSKTEWQEIAIASGNENLTSAWIHYNSAGSSEDDSDETPNNNPVYDPSLKDESVVPTPSESTISYGDAIVLHVDPSKIPEGGRVEWHASNRNFEYIVSEDKTTCTITPSSKGDTTFTALIYDAEGNVVSADEQTMTSKAGFFDKFVAFFKKLFGLTKVIPQIFKGIY